MDNSTYMALSHQMVLRRQMDLIANNIANMSTTAFKSQSPIFEEILVKNMAGETNSYVSDVGTLRNLQEGNFTPTSSPFDLAINGNGYFVIETPDGDRYTRGGHFVSNEEGELVTSSGLPVLDIDNNTIFIDPEAAPFTVSGDGTVSGQFGEPVRIQVVSFANEQELKKVSDGLYTTAQQPEEPEENIKIVQYMLEDSNVQPIVEMSQMILVHRSYQASGKMNKTGHELQRKMIDTIGKTS